MKKLIGVGCVFSVVVIAFVSVFIISRMQNNPKESKESEGTVTPTSAVNQEQPTLINTPTVEPTKAENKLCDWVDKSDIIIKVKFTEGVVKDGAYETGFYFDSITSTMRLARKDCDYRTGFSFEELKKAGETEVGVRGYSDSKRRSIVGEPISVNFNEKGEPSIGNYIEVTITN